jgi:hypothetical protein
MGIATWREVKPARGDTPSPRSKREGLGNGAGLRAIGSGSSRIHFFVLM